MNVLRDDGASLIAGDLVPCHSVDEATDLRIRYLVTCEYQRRVSEQDPLPDFFAELIATHPVPDSAR